MTLRDDLRSAWRQWRRAPGATVISVTSLTLGLAGAVAIFSLVDALLWRTLPVPEPHRLVRVVGRDLRPGEQHEMSVPTHVWEHIRDHQVILHSVLAVSVDRVNLARDGQLRQVGIAYVDAGYFDTLGIGAVAGRTLRPLDEVPANAAVAVISHSLWQRDYAGRSDIVGQPIYLDAHRFEIVGVTPRGFFGLEVGRIDDVMVPLAAQDIVRGRDGQLQGRAGGWLQVYGRLHQGQTIDAAAAALRAWYPALRTATARADAPDDRHLPYPIDLAPATAGHSFVRAQYAQALSLTFAAVGVLLTIACINLAVLAMARFSDRAHELGVRLSLGASRPQIVRLLVTENAMLVLASSVAGVWLGHVLATAVAPYLSLPRANVASTELVLSVDARLLAAAAMLTSLTAAVAALVPALRSTHLAPHESLGDHRPGGRGRSALRFMRTLAAGQVAGSVVLLVGAALLVRSFVELTTRPSGIDRSGVLVVSVTDPFAAASPAGYLQRIEQVRAALATTPGVLAASGAWNTPLGGLMTATNLRVPGSLEPTPMGGAGPFNYVLPGYFDVLGTPLLSGRDFTHMDVFGGPIGRRHVAVVNQAFAQRHFGGFNPIGRVLLLGTRELEIVGVVATSRFMSLREDRDVAMAFGALAENPRLDTASLRFVVRTTDPRRVQSRIVSAVRGVDPRLLVELRTLNDDALMTINRERLLAWAGGALAGLGLLMAVLGLYGTFAYAVVRRQTEVGVRLALGADAARVLKMFLGEAAVVVTAGSGIGLATAWAMTRSLETLLFGISPRDPLTFALAAASIVAAAALATYIPARRAARVHPATALRAE